MDQKKKGLSEDLLALLLGLFIFALGMGPFFGCDLLGWAAKPSIWVDFTRACTPVSANYKSLSGFASLFYTYSFLLALMFVGALALRAKVGKFLVGFTIVFWMSYLCWAMGHYAQIAEVDSKVLAEKYNLTWSLRLSGEAGFILALLAGIIIGNFFPRFAAYLAEVARPELFVKTAIVILGAALATKVAGRLDLGWAVVFRGLCASVEVYLIDWAVVYLVARTIFKFNREWAVPLASGISICGVSAAIATGAAIRARPVVPIMVSSLVVIFAVVELIILPFMSQALLWREPMVAGDWMGLAVKTDGAAIASGAMVESLVQAKTLAVEGYQYEPKWIMMPATTSKIFIDVFIGVWAFLLAVIWCTKIECKGKVRAVEIWERFPKFVIGYFLTFLTILIICLSSKSAKNVADTAMNSPDLFRSIFFALTFFTIGVISNFRKLWEEGIGKLAAVYVLCLFGFIIWVGLAISYIFFHGIKPPIVGG
jgi:uncharacterized membrane protein YadS